jgi:hypothetical protein
MWAGVKKTHDSLEQDGGAERVHSVGGVDRLPQAVR